MISLKLAQIYTLMHQQIDKTDVTVIDILQNKEFETATALKIAEIIALLYDVDAKQINAYKDTLIEKYGKISNENPAIKEVLPNTDEHKQFIEELSTYLNVNTAELDIEPLKWDMFKNTMITPLVAYSLKVSGIVED